MGEYGTLVMLSRRNAVCSLLRNAPVLLKAFSIPDHQALDEWIKFRVLARKACNPRPLSLTPTDACSNEQRATHFPIFKVGMFFWFEGLDFGDVDSSELQSSFQYSHLAS